MAALTIEALHVGQGDSTLVILPNGKTVLIDCHFTGNDMLEYFISKLARNDDGKPVLDCMVITHPHQDHIGGIGELGERVVIKQVWESGHRLYIPKDQQSEYPDYYDMLKLFQKIKARGGQVIVKSASARGFHGGLDESVQWHCLSPSRSYAEEERATEDQIHEECLVLKLSYAGRSAVFTGDTTWKSWKERIVPNYPELVPATILHASHHGSITFFANSANDDPYIDHLKLINPDITVIPVGPNNHGHPDPKAVELYTEYTYHYSTSRGQVFRTDKLGNLCLRLFDNGTYDIMPEYHRNALKGRFNLCRAWVEPTPNPDPSGTYARRVPITFHLRTSNFSGAEVGRVTWEVQNNGIGKDGRVHDWYPGDSSSQTYSNTTLFHGVHNLYVRVLSRHGTVMAELVHLVKVRDEG